MTKCKVFVLSATAALKAPSAAQEKLTVLGEDTTRSVPFCFREATCTLRSASRTCSVPWSPAAVTWFPLRQHRSTAPVYSHDTSVKSKVYPAESGQGAPGASMMDRRWSWGSGGDSSGERPHRARLCLIWAARPRSHWFEGPVVKVAATKYATSVDIFKIKLKQLRIWVICTVISIGNYIQTIPKKQKNKQTLTDFESFDYKVRVHCYSKQ